MILVANTIKLFQEFSERTRNNKNNKMTGRLGLKDIM